MAAIACACKVNKPRSMSATIHGFRSGETGYADVSEKEPVSPCCLYPATRDCSGLLACLQRAGHTGAATNRQQAPDKAAFAGVTC